jgi:hypothetical protein
MDIVRLDTLMSDNLVYLVNFISIFYMQITQQLIPLNQRSKSDKYHKNNRSSIEIKIVLFLFLRLGLLFLNVTLGTGFQSVKSTFVFRKKR